MIRPLIQASGDENGSSSIEVVMLLGFAAIAGVFLIKSGHAFISWGYKIIQLALFS